MSKWEKMPPCRLNEEKKIWRFWIFNGKDETFITMHLHVSWSVKSVGQKTAHCVYIYNKNWAFPWVRSTFWNNSKSLNSKNEKKNSSWNFKQKGQFLFHDIMKL